VARGVTTTGMTRCEAGAEMEDGIPVETEMIRVALQLSPEGNMNIEIKVSTRQLFELTEKGMSKRHGRELLLCLNH
jgi:hypothetical protein